MVSNLLDEPWLPVIRGGRYFEVGVREALLNAGSYSGLQGETPLMSVALLRLLLAVLTDALRPTKVEEVTGWFSSTFPVTILEDYFAKFEASFDLFGREKPFYQIPYLTLNHSWTQLSATHNKISTAVLFDHTDAIQPLPITRAAAARHLVTDQTFTLSSGRTRAGYASSGPLASGLAVCAVGDDLHETLCFNLVPQPEHVYDTDAPVWRRESPASENPGFLELYTPLSRRVRLQIPKQIKHGVVRIGYERGERCTSQNDPMLLTRRRKGKYVPIKTNVDSQPWLSVLEALCDDHFQEQENAPAHALRLLSQTDQAKFLSLMVTGQSTVKPARAAFIFRDHLSLSTAVLTDRARRARLAEVIRHIKGKARWLSREGTMGITPSSEDTYWARLKAYCLNRLADSEDISKQGVDALTNKVLSRHFLRTGARP